MLPDIRPDDLQELVDAFASRYSKATRTRFMKLVYSSAFITTAVFLQALPSDLERMPGVGPRTVSLAADILTTILRNTDYYNARILDDVPTERSSPERNPALKVRRKRRR